MAYIGREPRVGNFQVCDAISVVNGQAAYTMQVNSTNVSPETENHMLVSLNGILQKPGSSFTISAATITFASNLVTNDVIDFIIILGNVLDLGVPSDDTVGAAQIKDDLISGTTALTSAPADTDEFLVSDAGTLKRIDYSLIKGGGKINQVVSTHFTTKSQMSSNSFAAISGMSVAITPSASSSKIYITLALNAGLNASSYAFFKLYRDSTLIGSGSDDGNRIGCNFSFSTNDGGDASDGVITNHYQYLDSPSSTSELTYTVQAATYNNTTITYNKTPNNANNAATANTSSVITAIEVLA